MDEVPAGPKQAEAKPPKEVVVIESSGKPGNADGDVKKEEVVVKEVGKVRPVLTGIQWVGTGLAVGVGGLIAIVTILIVAYALAHALPPPTVPEDADRAAKLIANFKLLSDVQWSGPSGLFDAVVVKALLPVFTAILGYIFGSRLASKDEG